MVEIIEIGDGIAEKEREGGREKGRERVCVCVYIEREWKCEVYSMTMKERNMFTID